MKTITILAQKGGTGKTTLSIHLAAIASAGGKKTAIADIDPQQSAVFWKKRRENPKPDVIGIPPDQLLNTQKRLATHNTDLLIIDTAPHSKKDSSLAARAADLVLIPTRPAILDLEAIRGSVEILKTVKKKGAVILNACPFPGPEGERAIVGEAREALAIYGLPIAPVALSNRVAFSHSLIDGRAVTEFDTKGKAAEEINTLFRWMEELIW